MKTIEDVRELVTEKLNEYGWEVNFPIEVNNRFTSTLGRCRYVHQNGKYVIDKMEFAKELMDNGSDEEIISVALHETAHICVFLATGGENHGHDAVFKEWAVKLGTPPKSTTKVHYEATVKPYRYFGYCSDCGKLVIKRRTKSAYIRNIAHYHSNCCKARIVIENQERR